MIAILAMVALVGGHHLASAAVAQVISYQGRLTDGSNNPLTNPALSVTFKIYAAPTGPGPLWTEGQTVAVSDGLFHVLLGSGTAFPSGLFGTAPRYLGIQVGADPEMTPRQQIASAPSALQVGSVDGASGGAVTGDLTLTGKLGIGTASPVTTIHIATPGGSIRFPDGSTQTSASVGSASNVSSLLDAFVTADADANGSGDVHLQIGAADALRITNSGNVGIGTPTPSQRLHVAGSIRTTGELQITPTGSLAMLRLDPGAGFDHTVSMENLGAVNWQFGTTGGDYRWLKGGSGEVMRLTSGGSLGIGNVSPSEKLEVTGNAKITGTLFSSNVSSNSPLRLQTGGTTRMYIDDVTGNVGIGTTTPTATLHIATGGIRFPDNSLMTSAGVGSASTVTNALDAIVTADNDANGSGDVRLKTGGSDRLTVANGGNVGIGTSSPNSALQVAGSFATSVTTTASSMTLDASQSVVLVNVNGFGTITLPSPAGIAGRQYTIKNIGGSATVTTSNGASIDGLFSYNLFGAYKYITVVCDGSNWWIIANN